jgi:hypothetical protein
MTLALALSALLVTAAAPARGSAGAVKLQQGQSEFKNGDFLGALRTLDAAAAEATDDALLGQIHLLRGQCLAARQDFPGAEEAFRQALEHDPEVRLDPSKVDPALVTTLDKLRGKLRGELVVRADRAEAQVSVDGRRLGQAPFKSSVPIGPHSVEVRSVDGLYGASMEVVVRHRQTTEVNAQLKELPAPYRAGDQTQEPHEESARPFGDLRSTIDPLTADKHFGFEVGGGLEYRHFRASVSAILFPDFGIALRGALNVPVQDRVSAYVSLEVPVLFDGSAAFGLGGAGGLEYDVNRWFDPFFEVGLRHFFTGVENADPNRLVFQIGVRLKAP